MNLDELLASLNTAAQADLSALPLLDVDDYIAAIPRAGEVAALAPHVYVGCFGLWLFAHNAFDAQRARDIAAAGGATLSPATFARDAMAGKLMTDEVAAPFRDFVRQYTRELMVYATDYVETLVAPRMLRDMFDVQDLTENARAVARTIEERHRRYLAQQADWASTEPIVATYALTAAERTEPGWLASLAVVTALHDVPEATRRQALATFWALVDYAPEIASPAVIDALVGTFTTNSDSGVMQSVLNALKDMDFTTVLTSVLADAVRLQHDGEWLGVLLGLWGGDVADENLSEFQHQIRAIGDSAIKEAVAAATEKGLQQREPWATHADMALRR
jgi:hypothetical protein